MLGLLLEYSYDLRSSQWIVTFMMQREALVGKFLIGTFEEFPNIPELYSIDPDRFDNQHLIFKGIFEIEIISQFRVMGIVDEIVYVKLKYDFATLTF